MIVMMIGATTGGGLLGALRAVRDYWEREEH